MTSGGAKSVAAPASGRAIPHGVGSTQCVVAEDPLCGVAGIAPLDQAGREQGAVDPREAGPRSSPHRQDLPAVYVPDPGSCILSGLIRMRTCAHAESGICCPHPSLKGRFAVWRLGAASLPSMASHRNWEERLRCSVFQAMRREFVSLRHGFCLRSPDEFAHIRGSLTSHIKESLHAAQPLS